jgi:hypothetical protein
VKLNVGDKVRIVDPKKSQTPGTVVEVSRDSQGCLYRVRFTGPEWYFPNSSWFSGVELALVTT